MRNLLSISVVAFMVFLFAQPASAAITGEWLFNDGSGNVAADTSGNGNDGAIEGGFEWRSTPGGTGVYLDGISGLIDFGRGGDRDGLPLFDFGGRTIPGTPFFEPATIEAWFSVAVPSAGLGQGPRPSDLFQVFGKEIRVQVQADPEEDQSYRGFAILHRNTPEGQGADPDFAYEDAEAGRTVDHSYFGGGGGKAGFPAIEKDIGSQGLETYHHFVLTQAHAADCIDAYYNGVSLEATGGCAPILQHPMNLYAGYWESEDIYTEMVIDEARTYDEYLNGAQILALFEAGPAGGGQTFLVSDLDQSGAVDVVDFGLFAGVFGLVDSLGDLDRSGGPNDVLDLGIFAGEFGQSAAPTQVITPEPTTLMLVGLGVLWSTLRRAQREPH